MMAELVTQIERLIGQSEGSKQQFKKERLHSQIQDLTRHAAAEFGRLHRWHLSAQLFPLSELATCSADIQITRQLFDHAYYYRDSGGRPVAIAVHLYDWPDVGPDVEMFCEKAGLRYDAPADYPSWWYPGWTQLVIYTRPSNRRRRKRPSAKGQLDLPFGGGHWVV